MHANHWKQVLLEELENDRPSTDRDPDVPPREEIVDNMLESGGVNGLAHVIEVIRIMYPIRYEQEIIKRAKEGDIDAQILLLTII